jgi:hypothetical protein
VVTFQDNSTELLSLNAHLQCLGEIAEQDEKTALFGGAVAALREMGRRHVFGPQQMVANRNGQSSSFSDESTKTWLPSLRQTGAPTRPTWNPLARATTRHVTRPAGKPTSSYFDVDSPGFDTAWHHLEAPAEHKTLMKRVKVPVHGGMHIAGNNLHQNQSVIFPFQNTPDVHGDHIRPISSMDGDAKLRPVRQAPLNTPAAHRTNTTTSQWDFSALDSKTAEQIPGGASKYKRLLLKSWARRTEEGHKALQEGIRVELEHTDDPKVAEEIALDHLDEDREYYTKLKTVHKDAGLPMKTADINPLQRASAEAGEIHGDQAQPRLMANPGSGEDAKEFENGYEFAQSLGSLGLVGAGPQDMGQWQHSDPAWRAGLQQGLRSMGRGDLADALDVEDNTKQAAVIPGRAVRLPLHALAAGAGAGLGHLVGGLYGAGESTTPTPDELRNGVEPPGLVSGPLEYAAHHPALMGGVGAHMLSRRHINQIGPVMMGRTTILPRQMEQFLR